MRDYSYAILTNLTSADLASATSLMQGSDAYLYLTPAVSTLRNVEEAVCQMSTNGAGLASAAGH